MRFSVLDMLAVASYLAICCCCVNNRDPTYGRFLILATVLVLAWLMVRSYRQRSRFLLVSTLTAFVWLVLCFGTGIVPTAFVTPVPWWINPLTPHLRVFPQSPVDLAIKPTDMPPIRPGTLGIADNDFAHSHIRLEAAYQKEQSIRKEGRDSFNYVRLTVCVSSFFVGVMVATLVELFLRMRRDYG